MKRTRCHRPLTFEQLETKAAPSSILLVISTGNTEPGRDQVATASASSRSLCVGYCQYETEQILQFIADNTTSGEHSHRPAARPTPAECEASDEMMRQVAIESNSFFVFGFCEVETEL